VLVDLVDALRDDVDALGEAAVGGVGIAVAGWIDSDRSTVLTSPHLEAFARTPLGSELAGRIGLPVTLENDANAAAWAECRRGAARGSGDAVVVTLGSGVGAGIVVNDALVRGANGVAGEVGHTRVAPDGPPCPCGRNGCLDMFASGRALARHFHALGGEPTARGQDVTEAARAGDPRGIQAFGVLAAWLARGLVELVVSLDPAVVVLGGGVADAGQLLREPVQRELHHLLESRAVVPRVRVAVAELGTDAGDLGAAWLAEDCVGAVG